MAHKLPITIIFSLLLFKLVASDGFITSCKTNQTLEYQNNLSNLFNNFITSASISGFQNNTAGESPNIAYGLYQCRGDATSTLCRSCVTNLTNWVLTEPAACTEGYGYMDDCMIHYANYSFFGVTNNSVLVSSESWNKVTNVGEFNRTLKSMMEGLINDAFKSVGLFATREATVGGDDGKLYGLAQCTQDIGKGNCSACLNIAYRNIQRCCGGMTSAWFMLTNCQLRFDNSSFYEVLTTGGGGSAAIPNAQAVSAAVLLLVSWCLFLFGLLF